MNEIEKIEKKLLSIDQVDIEVTNSFSPGLYAREIFVPKGVLLIGHKHKKSCLNILAQGEMLIKSNEEDEGVIIKSPHTFSTDAGVRKLGYAIEDCVFINVFKTDETDLDKLEDELIEKSKSFIEHQEKDILCHG